MSTSSSSDATKVTPTMLLVKEVLTRLSNLETKLETLNTRIELLNTRLEIMMVEDDEDGVNDYDMDEEDPTGKPRPKYKRSS